jgi:Lrp/AsnC family leucine-responsive transcriptional regulator
MTEYRRLLGEILHVADGGQSKSYVVMEEVKETLAVSIAR